MTNAITPPGERPPFTTDRTRDETLTWWQQNRQSEIGKSVLSQWPPERVVELDAALADYHTRRMPDALVDNVNVPPPGMI